MYNKNFKLNFFQKTRTKNHRKELHTTVHNGRKDPGAPDEAGRGGAGGDEAQGEGAGGPRPREDEGHPGRLDEVQARLQVHSPVQLGRGGVGVGGVGAAEGGRADRVLPQNRLKWVFTFLDFLC